MMHPIDWLVAQVSPERGEARVAARLRLSAKMQYDAARRSRRTESWKAPAGSAESAARFDRVRLRDLSRDMIRNRPFAARIRDVVTVNVVGTGIKPSVELLAPARNEALSKARRDAVMAMVRRHLLTTSIDAEGHRTLPMMQVAAMNAVFSDGDVILRRRYRNNALDRDLPMPFQVQMMESDHLDLTKTSNGENEVIDGVEYGPTGRVEAYHLFDHHPGDAWGLRRARRFESRRVPAADVILLARRDRPGQVRGVPWLAPVMLTLGEISDYQEAQILKQRMAALLAGVITSDDSGTEFTGGGLEELAPGALVGLKAGQEISWTSPPRVEDYDDFMRAALAACAVGVGLTYEAVSGDLRRVNFSSGRMGRMEMDRMVETWQQHILIGQMCEGIARWFSEAWGLMQNVGEVDFALKWTAPRRPLIEPNREIPAMAAEVEAGFASTQGQIRRLGGDPEQIAQERAEDMASGLMPAAAAGSLAQVREAAALADQSDDARRGAEEEQEE